MDSPLFKNPLPLAILPDHLISNCKYLTSKKSGPCSWHLVVRLCIDDTSFYGGRGLSFRPQRPPEVCVGIRATFENANIGTASVAFGEGQGHLHPYITTSRPWLYYYCSVSFAKHIIIFNSSYLIISLSTWLVVGSQSSLKRHLNTEQLSQSIWSWQWKPCVLKVETCIMAIIIHFNMGAL